MIFPPVWQASVKSALQASGSYAKLLSGAAGRLVLSLAYFVAVANTLTVGDFGLFATASAIGIVLSRVAGFGFVSPLYRIATRKSALIGVYTAGLIAATALSLPLVVLLAALIYLALFAGEMAVLAFAAIMLAEIVFWRGLEVVCIVNNGMRRFGRGAITVITGSALRALAALGFAVFADGTLLTWALLYLGANALAAVLAIALYYPRQRLRFATRLYAARGRDALSVAAADLAFYLQSELDKVLVLGLGGAYTAGIYAILMRLIDLTALPMRSANTLIVQHLMVSADWLASWRRRWAIEAAIALVSIVGLGAIGLVLYIYPGALGANVADAAPFVLLALLVPAFRNLIEYESELLYARGRTTIRALILVFVGALKAGLITLLLAASADGTNWILGLNGVFATLWLASAACAYTAYDWRPRERGRPVSPAPQPSG